MQQSSRLNFSGKKFLFSLLLFETKSEKKISRDVDGDVQSLLLRELQGHWSLGCFYNYLNDSWVKPWT